MVTAYGDEERRRRAKEFGAAFFNAKPVDFDFLRAQLSRLLACIDAGGHHDRVWLLPSGKRNEALDTLVYALAARTALPYRRRCCRSHCRQHRLNSGRSDTRSRQNPHRRLCIGNPPVGVPSWCAATSFCARRRAALFVTTFAALNDPKRR